MADPPRRLVLCIGNPDRGDDGVGRLVARLLQGRLPDDVVVAECDGGATDVLDRMAGADCAIVVDAAVSGCAPGAIHRLDCAGVDRAGVDRAASDILPASGAASSHGLGVAEALALARALGCLPRTCVIYAVEAGQLAPGDALSPEVTDAARQVVERVILSLRDPRAAGAVSTAA